MNKLVVETHSGTFLPVLALYDEHDVKIDDPRRAYSFDVLDGVYTLHLAVPQAPNPSGFWWVQ